MEFPVPPIPIRYQSEVGHGVMCVDIILHEFKDVFLVWSCHNKVMTTGMEGFEPSVLRLTVVCITVMLHPIVYLSMTVGTNQNTFICFSLLSLQRDG